jgi:hypothetical protein
LRDRLILPNMRSIYQMAVTDFASSVEGMTRKGRRDAKLGCSGDMIGEARAAVASGIQSSDVKHTTRRNGSNGWHASPAR